MPERSKTYVQRCEGAGIDPTKPHLTATGAARVVGVHPATMARWLRGRRLRHFDLGRELQVAAEDLDAFLQRIERPANEAA